MHIFKYRQFKSDIILWAVRWYCKYGVSYRDLEEMLNERGIAVDHTTIYRWVICYAPKIAERLKKHCRPRYSRTWYVDETYVKIKGEWKYLYRAINKDGHTIDFYLSSHRNCKAAERFLKKSLNRLTTLEKPKIINTDKHFGYAKAITMLKIKGNLPIDVEHRRVKYLNNSIESDHGKLKRIIKPTLGFKSLRTARATIQGFELMRMIKKGQCKNIYDIKSEVNFIASALLA